MLLLLYVLVRAAPAARRQGPQMHYCSLYDVRRQPRRHQGRIMRSRVNVQIGLGVWSSRACLKPSFSRPLKRLLPLALSAFASSDQENLRGVMESRMVKLAWKFMRIQACETARLIASVLQTASLLHFFSRRANCEQNASTAYRWTRTASAIDPCERVESDSGPTRAPQWLPALHTLLSTARRRRKRARAEHTHSLHSALLRRADTPLQ